MRLQIRCARWTAILYFLTLQEQVERTEKKTNAVWRVLIRYPGRCLVTVCFAETALGVANGQHVVKDP